MSHLRSMYYRGHYVHLDPDDCATVEDHAEWLGRIVPTWRDGTGWVQPRPAGFDGAARVLNVGRSWDPFWWQPPAEEVLNPAECDRLAAVAVQILEHGWHVLTVERPDGWRVDAYGRPVVADYSAVGGLDVFEVDEWRSYADDLIAELDAKNGTDTPLPADGC